MKIDENDFFRQASLRISGSLDIGKAMMNFMEFAKDYLPISEISLGYLSLENTVIENLLTLSYTGKITKNPPFVLTPELTALFRELLRQWEESGNVVIIENNPAQHEIGMAGLPFFETKDPSVLFMHLVMDGVNIGGVALFAEGHGAFTPEHAHLLKLLREPFAIALSNALRYQELHRMQKMPEKKHLPFKQEPKSYHGDEIIGADKGLSDVIEMVRQVAQLSSPVMLLGETGVGKEVIADEIHRLSPRRDAPFIKVNCGAIPEGLIDAELFGYEKGAFTGAVNQKHGRFERADHGTIFLDEIGDLPLPAQVRLLRVLQNKEIERVGGTQTIRIDVRIICATNKNLEAMVREGTFREDLWYRLNIFPIAIPPLRQHTEDIPELVQYFLTKKARELKIHPLPQIPASAIEKLKTYSWPGNIRELENIIERLLIGYCGSDKSLLLEFKNHLFPEEEKQEHRNPVRLAAPTSLDDAMIQHILYALQCTGGKIEGPDGAAALLKINANTLRSRMRKYGIKTQRTCITSSTMLLLKRA